MEVVENTPDPDSLRRMPYSELKKLAKKHGIKSNMKAEKIRAAIRSLDSSDTDSFSTPAQHIINSSRKNKEKMFDEDSMTPLSTPRRGTYSLDESSASLKVEDASVLADTSALDVSNITFSRGSERKLRSRKVSFVTPLMMPSSPKNQSLRLRPKTPVASRTSISRRVSFAATPAGLQKRKSREKCLPVTPLPKFPLREGSSVFNSCASESDAATPLPSLTEASDKETSTPSVKLPQEDAVESDAVTPRPPVKEVSGKEDSTPSVKLPQKNAVESSSVKVLGPRSASSSKIKRFATPNFKQIHAKAFEKMESIDDYQKRKAINSEKKIDLRPNLRSKVTKAKSKIPSFSGIPFIPSVFCTESIKTDQKDKMKKITASVGVSSAIKIVKENASQMKKKKFDLKASLSRKLGYTPYKGPLKPLAESNNLNHSRTARSKEPIQQKSKEPINQVVNKCRLETRSAVRGVRTNKRFELQMRNRKLK